MVEFGENKTARAAAKVWAKLKGVDNNRTIEKTWNSGDNIFPVRVERKDIPVSYTKMILVIISWILKLLNRLLFQRNAIDAPQFLKDGQEGVSFNQYRN